MHLRIHTSMCACALAGRHAHWSAHAYRRTATCVHTPAGAPTHTHPQPSSLLTHTYARRPAQTHPCTHASVLTCTREHLQARTQTRARTLARHRARTAPHPAPPPGQHHGQRPAGTQLLGRARGDVTRETSPFPSRVQGPKPLPSPFCSIGNTSRTTRVQHLQNTPAWKPFTESQNGRGWKGPLWVI